MCCPCQLSPVSNNGVVRILEISNAFGLGEVVRRRNADYHCAYEPPATLIDRIFGAVEIHNNLKISTVVCGVHRLPCSKQRSFIVACISTAPMKKCDTPREGHSLPICSSCHSTSQTAVTDNTAPTKTHVDPEQDQTLHAQTIRRFS